MSAKFKFPIASTNPSARSSLYIVSLGLVWGLSYALIKYLSLTGIVEMQFIAVASVPLAIALFALARVRGQSLPNTLWAWVYCTVCAGLIAIAPVYLTLLVLNHITLGLLVVIVATSSLLTFLLSLALGEDRFSWFKMAGIVVGFVAIAILLAPKVDWRTQRLDIWIVVAFAIPVVYAVYDTFVSKFWPKGNNAIGLAFGETVMAFVLTAPVALATWKPDRDVEIWREAALLVAVLVVIWVFERVLFFAAIQFAGAIMAATAAYLATALAVVFGIILFDEPVDPTLWLSLALLIVAVGLTSHRTHSRLKERGVENAP